LLKLLKLFKLLILLKNAEIAKMVKMVNIVKKEKCSNCKWKIFTAKSDQFFNLKWILVTIWLDGASKGITMEVTLLLGVSLGTPTPKIVWNLLLKTNILKTKFQIIWV
jgi:hypothetical protein